MSCPVGSDVHSKPRRDLDGGFPVYYNRDAQSIRKIVMALKENSLDSSKSNSIFCHLYALWWTRSVS